MNISANIASSLEPATITTPQLESKALLESASALVTHEIDAVNQLIRSEMNSDIALINTLGEYIIRAGGKRLRPLILLLSAKALSYSGDHHVTLAAVIEFIHTATLLHDDVVDASTLRRGNPTANDIWGNEASVLVGDFLYSRSFEMMVRANSMPVMDVMAVTTNVIAEGEVLQLLNAHVAETSEVTYLKTIYRKTARLFESAAQLGGIIAQAPPEYISALADYGKHLGNAFQLIDDLLDYQASSDEMGKNTGDDLAEGKPTLPLIEAMRCGTSEQASIIKSAIENSEIEKLDIILEIVQETGALQYSHDAAQVESQAAIEAIVVLPESEYKDALINLAQFSTSRSF
jgi:octaprenyl-diphosphate synthase